MSTEQVSFKKKYKAKAIAGSCIIYFLAFPLLYSGVVNDTSSLMLAGLALVSFGILLDIIFG